jgi:hypothetical protein
VNPLHGYLHIIDESITEKEKTIKQECPNTLLRAFKNIYKTTVFAIPQECCVMTYEGVIIAIEKSAINERYFEGIGGELKLWTPNIIHVFERILEEINDNWYIDGSYLYSFTNEEIKLTDDGKFKALPVTAYALNFIGFNSELLKETRHCLKFTSASGIYVTTPPIWKSLTAISKSKTDSEEVTALSKFDKMDEQVLVNLQFAISSGIALTRTFGYQVIEPLQLPKIMAQLKTINLQSLTSECKQTFDIGMTFTQTCAWLMGLSRNAKTFSEMMVIRRLLRYLTTNGNYSRTKLKQVVEAVEVPLLTIDQAYENIITRQNQPS